MTKIRERTRLFSASALKSGVVALALASAGALFAGTVAADPDPQGYGWGGGRGGSGGGITLFADRNFGGEAITVNGSETGLDRARFNDKASSIRIGGGAWEVCEHGDFGGKCVVFDRDVRDLRDFGLNDNISSVRPVSGRGGGYGGGGGWGRDDDRGGYGGGGRDRDDGFGRQEGYVGEYAVFFPRPLQYGRPLEAYKGAADLFCKRQGFPDAVYARNNSGIVTDVLCRKR